MMELYLVQHGEAKPETEDPDRPLTARGAEAVERIAKWAVGLGLRVHEIRHSGKTRAAQTASMFARRLDPPGGATAVPGLKPNDDVEATARALIAEACLSVPAFARAGLGPAREPACPPCPSSARERAIMLVGHMPFLARLAGLLVAGNPETEVVRFQNGGIVCLEGEGGRWRVRWAVVPDLVGPGASAGSGRASAQDGAKP